MSRRVESALFTAALSCAAALFLTLALGLESRGRLGPILLAGIVLPLTLFQLRRDLIAPAAARPASSPHEKTGLAWALALPPAIYLIGCLGAVALHTLLFVRLRGGRSWRLAVICGALAGLPIYALARMMLRPELLSGALWKGLS